MTSTLQLNINLPKHNYTNIKIWPSSQGNKSHVKDRPFKVGSRKSEVGSRKSEVGSRKSEVGSRKSEVGSRKSEVGSRKSEVGSRKSEVGSRKSEVPPRLSYEYTKHEFLRHFKSCSCVLMTCEHPRRISEKVYCNQ